MQNDDGSWRLAFEQEAAFMMAAKGIEVTCYEWWPDLVLIVSGFFVPPEVLDVLRARGHKVVLIHTECPYEDNVQVLRAAHADLNVLNDPTNLAMFAETAPAMYVPHAYDPEVHKPGPAQPDLKCDFCFVGTAFQSRIDFLSAVDWTGLDVLLAGNWRDAPDSLKSFVLHSLEDCIDNTDAVKLYNSTKVSANLYRKEAHADATADGWAMGPREVELAACGTFFVREPRPEGDELFPMLPTFTEPAELGELVRWWAAHDSARESVAVKARDAIEGRTFAAHANDLLRLIAA